METDSRRWQASPALAAAVVGLSLTVGTPARAAEFGEEMANAFGRESEVTVHFRTYYLDRIKTAPSDLEAWAGGGWLGYRSGWLADIFRVGLVGYTSQPIYAPDDKDGTLLLKPGQKGYSVLGQAYGQLKLWEQVFTGYRQMVNEPEVNPQDNRMTPNTFQGYTLAGKPGGVSYFAGYLDKMKTRNSDEFRDFANVAGAPAGTSEGMWLGGVGFDVYKDVGLRLSSYHVPNILTSTYADGAWSTALSETLNLRLAGQYMFQSSNGDDLLTGSTFHATSGGVKADLQRGPAIFTVAYTQTGRSAAYRSPYGTWAGYTSMLVLDFNRAGEKAWLIGGTYDFAGWNMPGLALNVNAVFGRDAINSATGAALSDNNEYDFTLDYRFTEKTWPEWLRPLWIRARYARIEEKLADTATTNDYRIIVNYEWVFK